LVGLTPEGRVILEKRTIQPLLPLPEIDAGGYEEDLSKRNLDFLLEGPWSRPAHIQGVIGKVDLAGQNLLVAADKKECQLWGIEQIDRVSQLCGWPGALRDEMSGRIPEIARIVFKRAE